MAAAPAPVALVFFNDGGHCLLEVRSTAPNRMLRISFRERPISTESLLVGRSCVHAQGVEDEQQQEALLSLTEFVQDSIFRALNLSQFRHVQVVEHDTSAEPTPAVRSTANSGGRTACGTLACSQSTCQWLACGIGLCNHGEFRGSTAGWLGLRA